MTELEIQKLIKSGWVQKFDGDVVSTKDGDKFFIVDGELTNNNQTGGDCRAFNEANLTNNNQTGGYCRAFNEVSL